MSTHILKTVDCAHVGTLTYEGQIACECKQCRPGGVVKTQSVSCSEFEEHAGSRERRPAESIYLECISTSLKVQTAVLLHWRSPFCNVQHAPAQPEPDSRLQDALICGKDMHVQNTAETAHLEGQQMLYGVLGLRMAASGPSFTLVCSLF